MLKFLKSNETPKTFRCGWVVRNRSEVEVNPEGLNRYSLIHLAKSNLVMICYTFCFQAMIIDLLPAGFEIESTKPGDPIDFGPFEEAWEETEKQFVNAREDLCGSTRFEAGDDIF